MGRIISIASTLVSLYWIHQGVYRYGFWVKNSPGGGFIPVLFGLVVLLASIAVLLRPAKKGSTAPVLNLASFIPVGAAVAGIVLVQTLGISSAVFIFTFLWMKFLSKYSWVKSAFVSVLFTCFVFGIFKLWLGVPFPQGMIG